ncbi:hypothetical protein C6A85_57345, partial [Mycobacterium sp. ITM-2017-0098]
DRANGPAEITSFVLAIIAVVFGGFGLVSLVLPAVGRTTPGTVGMSPVILAIGVAAGVALFLTVRQIRRRRRRPLTSFTPVAVFDR